MNVRWSEVVIAGDCVALDSPESEKSSTHDILK
jgi:hypothetical protein